MARRCPRRSTPRPWVSAELAEFHPFPGLSHAGRVRKRVVELTTGASTPQTRSLATRLSPQDATRDHLLALVRRHWGIENWFFQVKDDGFDEDRHVLQRHVRREVLGLLRSSALNLLRGHPALGPPRPL